MSNPVQPVRGMEHLADIVQKLRSPEGCPWDRQQSEKDIGRHLLGEAYEVIDAIEGGSPAELREELGDLLFHIIFLCRLAEEKGEFNLEDVVREITEKMIRRHPHVFGGVKVESVGDVIDNWKLIKQKEGKCGSDPARRWLETTGNLPALMLAQKITTEAAKNGFDWDNCEGVLGKMDEELEELKAAVKAGDQSRIDDELGDVLLTMVNLCRFLNADAELSLRKTVRKFTSRFSFIAEELQKEGKTPALVSLKEMDRLWEKAKELQERRNE